eukprot:730275-Prymnesium_polylepis.1
MSGREHLGCGKRVGVGAAHTCAHPTVHGRVRALVRVESCSHAVIHERVRALSHVWRRQLRGAVAAGGPPISRA